LFGLWSGLALVAFYGVEGAFEVGWQDASGVEWAKDFSPVLDVFVAECLLQIADGCAVFEAVYGVAVAQGHGGDGFEDAGVVAGAADGEFDHAGAERCAVVAALEDVVGGRTAGFAVVEDGQEFGRDFEVAGLAAGGVQVQAASGDIAPGEVAQFADLESAAIEKSEHELVAGGVGGGEQGAGFVAAEDLGECFWPFGGDEVEGEGLPGEFVEDAAQDGDVHAYPAPGVVFLGQFDEVFLDEGRGDLGRKAAGVAVEAAQDGAVLGTGAFGVAAGMELGGDLLPEGGPGEGDGGDLGEGMRDES